jgi:hypothetical protein
MILDVWTSKEMVAFFHIESYEIEDGAWDRVQINDHRKGVEVKNAA